ncbi:protein MLN51 homolog [Durio zibethinus]|uniref:Protein MLN51 homolog n=1 Tax=Durio zibethinus TaxID=66656 RepID=A0A6P5X6K0_DURZI|nr:protein MLN51 homolog [Durio zibethinus]
MATAGEEEVEYDSDPVEVKRSLAMRRREAASDDEEGEREEDNNTEARMDRRAVIHSDESVGEGGAADYDDDEEELDLEEDEVYDEEEEEEEEIDEEEIEELGKGLAEGNVERTREDMKEARVDDGNGNVDEGLEINNNNHVGEEDDEEKENEPYAVPTAGAFYMHDDRFRDNVGGRHRRTHGGRKLWESKDDRKWGHDKFEEMTLQEKHYEEGRRSSRGRNRARSKNRGPDHGYRRGSRSKAFGKNNNQNQAPKVVRGRGPRRYEPTMKNSSQAPAPTQNKPSGKPLERTSQANSSRVFTPATNADAASVPARKHVFASSLSSASPPFYPSGSSNKDITLTQKKDVQAGTVGRNLRPSVTDENFSLPQSNSLRGKNVLDSLSMAKLYMDDSSTPASGKPLGNMQILPSGSSLGKTSQPSQSRVQGRGVAIPGQKAYQPGPHQNQAHKVSPPTQVNAVQRNPVQGRGQSSLQATAQQFDEHPGIGSQASSPPKTAMSVHSYESGEAESSETSKSKSALVSKGKSSVQGGGRGSFLYGGAQIIGATGSMAIGHGDQNFPAFLPCKAFDIFNSLIYLDNVIYHKRINGKWGKLSYLQQCILNPGPHFLFLNFVWIKLSALINTKFCFLLNIFNGLLAKFRWKFNSYKVVCQLGAYVSLWQYNFLLYKNPRQLGWEIQNECYESAFQTPDIFQISLFVANLQFATDFDTSERVRLPVLTGTAGALGAPYCPPYITVDGAYHTCPSGQASSTVSSSKENTSNKQNNEWKPLQRLELVSDEFGQQQNNPNKQPRRYSEMSFSK